MESAIAPATPVQPGIRSATTLSPPLQKTTSRCSLAILPAKFSSRMAVLKLNFHRNRTSGFAKRRNNLRIFVVRANGSSDEGTTPIAPFQPESPTGQYLTQLLQSHPHLVPAAVEQELERLAENRNSEDVPTEPTSNGSELVLYRRIAELKDQERRTALEEIIYTLIVQKFVDSGIAMVPNLSSVTSIEKPWPVQAKELEAVHSLEVLEMIRQHMLLVLGGQGGTEYLDHSTFAQISKLRVGQVYAASIIYGYFLRRIYQRFQLEKSMKLLPAGLEEASSGVQTNSQEEVDASSRQQQMAAAMAALKGLGATGPVQFNAVKPTMLQSYIMSIDVEILQRIATVRSRESLRVLEKHTEALFGRPEIIISPDGSMTVNKDEDLKISFAGLKRLVLEAVAFGSFLWDVESYVDASYAFVTS